MGEQQGEQDIRARCSPSRSPGLASIAVDVNAQRWANASANFNQRCELPEKRFGRRLVPPDKCDTAGEVVSRSTVT